MEIKELTELNLSSKDCKKKTWGRWKPLSHDSSAITIYLPPIAENDYSVIKYLVQTFLIEYFCSCVFRGNRFRKNCLDRKPSKKQRGYCIPGELASEMMDYLFDEEFEEF